MQEQLKEIIKEWKTDIAIQEGLKEKLILLEQELESKNKEIKELKNTIKKLQLEYPKQFKEQIVGIREELINKYEAILGFSLKEQVRLEINEWKQKYRQRFEEMLQRYGVNRSIKSDKELYEVMELIFQFEKKLGIELQQVKTAIEEFIG